MTTLEKQRQLARDESEVIRLETFWDDTKSAYGIQPFTDYPSYLGVPRIDRCLVKCHRCGQHVETRLNPVTLMTDPVECTRRGCYTLIPPRGRPTWDTEESRRLRQ